MKEDRVYLRHIRDSIDRVLAYTADGRDRFLADSKTQDAVVRNLEVIADTFHRLRVGDYRVMDDVIEDDRVVLVLGLVHRSELERSLRSR